jgi:uncharacterized protein
MTIIGVISDTHSLLRPESMKLLYDADLIVHAGDIGSVSVLDKLSQIAPVTAVCGNIDKGPWANSLPENEVLEVDGQHLYVLHNLTDLDLDPVTAGFQVVISGHSHMPKMEKKDDVLYFNPGSAGPRRFKLPISLGRLVIEGSNIRGEIHEIQL